MARIIQAGHGDALQAIAIRRLAQEQKDTAKLPLMQWIPAISPRYIAPVHLKPLVERLQTFREKPLRLVVHAPPRHVKTETLCHFFAWSLRDDPTLRHGYISYEANIARSKSNIARQIARRAGVEMDERQQAASNWKTMQQGGLLARGIGGPLTGEGITGVLVIDDPVKNRVEAESPTIRQKQNDWYSDVARTRLEKNASVVVCMTRWHDDDLAGYVLKKEGFEFIRLPALNDGSDPNRGMDEPLCPQLGEHAQKLALLDLKRRNEFSFASIYQGLPRPRGARIFNDVRTYRELPNSGNRWGGGVDLAYSAKTSSDWSVLVIGVWGGPGDGKLYITKVIRQQCLAPKFKLVLSRENETLPAGHAGFRWYASGTEEGVASFISDDYDLRDDEGSKVEGTIPLEVIPATADKFIRAQPVSSGWNNGDVLLPEKDTQWYGQWVEDFVEEVSGFTGTGGDATDDQVDALAALYDLLAPGSDLARWTALGSA